jgi:glycosyltransferase involved in cell wall biosynthesis
MRVLIFEPDHHGHRLNHVRHLVSALTELPSVRTTVALSAHAPQTTEFNVHLASVADSAVIDAWMPHLHRNPLKGALQRSEFLRQSLQRAQADWLYVPYGDGLIQVLGLQRILLFPALPPDIMSETLVFRGNFAYPQRTWRAKAISELSWRIGRQAAWSITHILDPVVYESLKARQADEPPEYRLMPDPVETPTSLDRVAARQRLGIPDDGRLIACAGIIDRRKGVDLLIHAFAAAGLEPTDRLLLAGQHEAEIRKILAQDYGGLVRANRIISLDRILENDDLLDAIVASDVVAALYPRHIGSASIAIRAAAAQRPVLAHNFGWLGLIVPRFELGHLCDATNPKALQVAIVAAVEASASYQQSQAARQFVDFNSIENFKASWTAAIRERLCPSART